MPVLPAVDSTTTPPGLSSPRFSASRIICLPARSFTDPPGFMNSALPRIVQPVASDARLSLMSGVWPIASLMPSRICMPDPGGQREDLNLVEAPMHHKVGENPAELAN